MSLVTSLFTIKLASPSLAKRSEKVNTAFLLLQFLKQGSSGPRAHTGAPTDE